jgi:hypothetical protein
MNSEKTSRRCASRYSSRIFDAILSDPDKEQFKTFMGEHFSEDNFVMRRRHFLGESARRPVESLDEDLVAFLNQWKDVHRGHQDQFFAFLFPTA